MKRYNPREIEAKWQKRWLKEDVYEPDFLRAKKPFYNLMMFPYPSAEGLHVGNMYAFTGADIYGRFKRMQGHDVFEPIGLDGFGIHSENYALKIGKHPAEQARISEKNFYRQLRTIGNGFAWREKLETYDPEYYKWTQWIFTQMFERGLAYRKRAFVNWCPECRTVLADEQVLAGECERCATKVVKKELEQWFFRITDYAERLLRNLENLPGRQAGIDWSERIKIAQKNWIGRSEGAEIGFEIKTKERPNFLILHGYTGRANKNFIPWLKEELKSRGFEVQAPQLPNTDFPEESEQVNHVFKNCRIDENTIIVGHSLGGVVAMKVLEKVNRPIAGLVLVAPAVEPKFRTGHERPFWKTFTFNYNYKNIQELAPLRFILSDTLEKDKRGKYLEYLSKKISAPLYEATAQRVHFTGEKESFILERLVPSIKVFTTRPDTLFGATYMVLAPEHELIKSLKFKVKNWDEVERYINKAKAKTDEERIAEGKEKTGVGLKGIKAINPANGEEIPIWVADYVLGNVGTGAIMAVPAHDQRDYEFAKKFKLPIRTVVEPVYVQSAEPGKVVENLPFDERDAIIAVVKHWSEEKYMALRWKKVAWGTFITGGIEKGQTPEEAGKAEIREETGYLTPKLINDFGIVHGKFYHVPKQVNRLAHAHVLYFKLQSGKKEEISETEREIHDVLWLSADELKAFLTPDTHQHALRMLLGAQEAYTGEGVLTGSGNFNGLDSEKAKWEITKFVGGERKVQYRLRDWLISRQRYWGPPIPMIHCEKCGWQVVPDRDLPVKLPHVKNFRPTGTEKSPLATVEKFWKVRCPKCKSWARRETDVSDTFLDSAWYYIGYLMAASNWKLEVRSLKLQEAVRKWLPVDMYIGGAEHAVLHLLYVRFLAMALHDWGLVHFEEPFKKFRAHGLLIKDGAKMSKSRGNVVNPDEYVRAYGADALRMYLMFLGPFEQGGDFRDTGIRGVTRFLERTWRFVENWGAKNTKHRAQITNKTQNTEHKLQQTLHRTVKKVTEDVEELQYNTAVAALMTLLNAFEENPEGVTAEHIKTFLKLLAPFAPHITEELYQQFFGSSKRFVPIHKEPWPKFDPKLIKKETFELVVQINGKIRDKFEAPVDISEEEATRLVLGREKIKKELEGRKLRKVVFVPERLINLVR